MNVAHITGGASQLILSTLFESIQLDCSAWETSLTSP